jgi:hypothetical protein
MKTGDRLQRKAEASILSGLFEYSPISEPIALPWDQDIDTVPVRVDDACFLYPACLHADIYAALGFGVRIVKF